MFNIRAGGKMIGLLYEHDITITADNLIIRIVRTGVNKLTIFYASGSKIVDIYEK